METCRPFFAPSPSIYIPRVYRDLSSHRICVMEFIHGIKVSNVSALHAAGIDTRHVASLCVEAFAEMIFQAPFLHVDPHAGNLLVRRDAAGFRSWCCWTTACTTTRSQALQHSCRTCGWRW